jgi:cytochrome d ubiquinol oxidase subunit II
MEASTDAPLFAYATLRLIWWLLLGVLLIGFAIMDGFDLGVGASFRLLGRTDAERRVLLEAIEPVWEGNQVWFILGGGAAFAAWPLVYASSFSGLYLAMFMLLVALILRPVGFVFRNQLTDARWRNVWDTALTLGGAVPSLLFGVAFGNLFLGLPFHYDDLQRSTYTGGFFGLLSPFALLAGVTSLSMLVLHGTSYAAFKVGEPMAARARNIGRIASLVFLLSFVGAGFWLGSAMDGFRIVGSVDHDGPSNPVGKAVALVAGGWLGNFHEWPWLWVAPAAAIVGAASAHLLLRARRAGVAFLMSAIVQAGTILTAGFALFPFLMPSSTNPAQSLTVWDASSSARTLAVMLAAVVVLLPIVLAYTTWVFRVMKGRVTLETLAEHDSDAGPY